MVRRSVEVIEIESRPLLEDGDDDDDDYCGSEGCPYCPSFDQRQFDWKALSGCDKERVDENYSNKEFVVDCGVEYEEGDRSTQLLLGHVDVNSFQEQQRQRGKSGQPVEGVDCLDGRQVTSFFSFSKFVGGMFAVEVARDVFLRSGLEILSTRRLDAKAGVVDYVVRRKKCQLLGLSVYESEQTARYGN